ncbi:MAG: N-acetylglutaminylglutamine amidotransferase, partial [Phycisphaerales bacterium]|nr:N-acetylglutaminylglutamine amidotransferase [Phycisphaerales bacterium]
MGESISDGPHHLPNSTDAIPSPSTPSLRPSVPSSLPPRFALVFNGLIYNYRELAAHLGFERVPACDTEVVLAACARWGPDALNRFNGMFALAFYDRAERRGFLARDPFGIKPLFYADHARRLTFASEIFALRPLDDWSSHIDPDALNHY